MSILVRIFVDNLDYGDTCYAGQTLTGRVECNFGRKKKLRAVRVKFEGKCNTSWSQTDQHYDAFHKRNTARIVNYKAEEIYFIHQYNLVGDGNQFTLPAGRYTYPFSYILPQLLPSNFTNDLGQVVYTIKATVDCPWQVDDHATVMLKLIAPFDFNLYPQLRQAAEVSVDKTLFSWSLSLQNSDPLTFKMALPIAAYAAGQQVRVNAYVCNMSHVSAEKVIFKIVKLMEFTVHHPNMAKRQSSSVVVSCSEGGIGAHSEKSWTAILTIPTNDLYPNLIHCKLINISYELQGEVVVPFPHTNLSARLPLMIGHLPLVDVNTGRSIIQTNVGHPYPSAPPLSHFDAAAPPTYEEAQWQVPSNSSVPQRKLSIEDSFEIIS